MIAALTSCEGYVEYSGRVVDINTGGGIDSVSIVLTVDGSYIGTYNSDTTGYFNIVYGVVGCVPSCPSSELKFEKEQYYYKRKEERNDTVVYLMEKF